MTAPNDTVSIARSTSGPAGNAAGAAAIFAVIGAAAAGDVATPFLARNDGDPSEIHTGGPMPEVAEIISSYSRAATIPVRATTDEPGSYEAIDISGFAGTAVPSVDASVVPYINSEVYIDFPTGGTLGDATQGITWRASRDGGNSFGPTMALGAAYQIDVDSDGATPLVHARILMGLPSAQVTALIAAAVEARADTLAHLADVSAHDAADTSAAQVALAASGVPATEAAAWAVLNLCRTALASHEGNITAHNGSDIVNVVSHAAATNGQTGVELFAEYRTRFNAHLGIALAAATAGLRAATATVASIVVLTTSDLLDAGEALLAVYPRRLSFTTAGSTASDAPANAVIVGVLGDGTTGGETRTLSQTAAAVFTVNDYRSITSITFPAADGTGATIAIGYGMGVHNSADVTNTIAATAPTHGTVVANNVIQVETNGPTIDAASLTACFDALEAFVVSKYGGVVVVGAFDPSVLWAALIAGLDGLRGTQIPVIAVIEARPPTDAETPATYRLALEAEWAAYRDERVHVCAGKYGRYDPATLARCAAQLRRSHLAPLVARLAALDYGESPGVVRPSGRSTTGPSVFGGTLAGYKNYDDSGSLIGHDERVNPGLQPAGFGVVTTFRNAPDPLKPYVFQPKNKTPTNNRAPHIAHQRVLTVVEAVLYTELTLEIETGLLYEPGRDTIRADLADSLDALLRNRVLAETGDPAITSAARISRLLVLVDRNAAINPGDPEPPAYVEVDTRFYVAKFSVRLNVNRVG